MIGVGQITEKELLAFIKKQAALIKEQLDFIDKQQKIIDEAKKIIKYNKMANLIKTDPFYYKSYMSDFIEVVEKNINKMEQENDK